MTIKYPHKDDPRWIRGEPYELQTGMFVIWKDSTVWLIGDLNSYGGGCECGNTPSGITHHMPVGPIEAEPNP